MYPRRIIMILPATIGKNRGSFSMTLPRPICLVLKLDEKLLDKNNVKLIVETVEEGVLLRYPTEKEIKRFGL